jgi:hypothetical protein
MSDSKSNSKAPLRPISPEKYLDCVFQIGAALATDPASSSTATILSGRAVRITNKLLENAGFCRGTTESLEVAEGL